MASDLPSISIIENAIKYNYLDQKLIEYSFIPSELLNLYVNYYQHLLVAQEVQSFKSEYITALIYNYQNLQFESLLKQYGINEALLNVIKLFAQVRKIVTGLQELYLTPTKALSISEYVSNPQQLLQKVFTEFQIPQELQNTYFEYKSEAKRS
ncbi:hypothetical protein GCM10009431_31160 [Gaetbulibacter jejuensis]|uniref:Uncharacterized protein n=1 Tax=Gaetbulibacter jejuensis TaxID=584607 RepID=A0ABN1JZV4_9FLAO